MSYFRTIEVSDPRFEKEGLRHITVKSPSLSMRGDISIFVPEIPGKPSHIPLVILLHGVYGSHWAWAMKAGAHITAQKLINEGKIRPMILAMPSDGLWGDGSGYLPHHEKDFGQWIVKDVPIAVFEAISGEIDLHSIFIAGLSMGGFGAMYLGSKYPEVFHGISAHSALSNTRDLKAFVEEKWEAPMPHLDLKSFLIEQKAQLPPLRFDCGKDDELLKGNQELHEALKKEGIPHTYEEFPGGHEWSYWEAYLEKSLIFFENTLD